MSSVDPPAPSATPVPFGVLATTGEPRSPLAESDLDQMAADSGVVLQRAKSEKKLGFDSSVDDETDLSQTGWGVLFASDADPAIKAALQPLLDWRRSQVNDDKLFKIFEGKAGVRPAQTASSWVSGKGVSLVAPVSPAKGVPYYLLIVGSPMRIPFEFQALLDLQWAVGRLHFDQIGDYAAYAEQVVAYEKGQAPPQSKHTAMWVTRNPGDMATALLAGSVCPDFLGQTGDGTKPLGSRQQFRLSSFCGDGQATKAKLASILRGEIDGGRPSILFTGSHGAEWPMQDAAQQRRRQGALVTQEWSRGQALNEDNCFEASDVTADAQLHGTMVFIFSCFGGGCPDTDSYRRDHAGDKIPIAPEPLIAALPQALLRQGALAVIAHIDRAFTYGFEDALGSPQVQLFRTPLELLMKGKPIGFAADPFNLQWGTLAAQIGLAQSGNLADNPNPSKGLMLNLFIARDDARNYIVLGDPATRLRIDAMT
jgi:hypothetical protein